MTDDELSNEIVKTCDTEKDGYYVCSIDKKLYYDPMKSQRTLEIDELTECEVNDQSEAMAKWLAITLTEKMFRGKEWIYYKKRVESKQMTIFDYLEV